MRACVRTYMRACRACRACVRACVRASSLHAVLKTNYLLSARFASPHPHSVKAFTRWEKFLHSLRAVPFVTVAHFQGAGVASSALVQFASMCDLWVADEEDDDEDEDGDEEENDEAKEQPRRQQQQPRQVFTVCGGGSGQLVPGSFLFRVAKSGAGLSGARSMLLQQDPARTTKLLRRHLLVPAAAANTVLGKKKTPPPCSRSQASPHSSKFLTAFRTLLQESCHENVDAFLRRHAAARASALGLRLAEDNNTESDTVLLEIPQRLHQVSASAAISGGGGGSGLTTFFDLKAHFGPNLPTSRLLRAAINEHQLPPSKELNAPDFASSLSVFVSAAGVLSIRFADNEASSGSSSGVGGGGGGGDGGGNAGTGAPVLSALVLLELAALFDFFDRGAVETLPSAICVIIPQGGFADDSSVEYATGIAERTRVLLGFVQLLMLRSAVPSCVAHMLVSIHPSIHPSTHPSIFQSIHMCVHRAFVVPVAVLLAV